MANLEAEVKKAATEVDSLVKVRVEAEKDLLVVQAVRGATKEGVVVRVGRDRCKTDIRNNVSLQNLVHSMHAMCWDCECHRHDMDHDLRRSRHETRKMFERTQY